ncbi:MAG: hypothetical protein ACRCS8_03070 [Brevinema sp.]
MRNIYLLLILFMTSSCAIEGEIYRLQTRMSHWNKLLNESELQLFAENQTNELGTILDQKEADPEFAQKLRQLRVNEAIMSFDGVQTAHFFYHTLLKDLVKFSYEEFMTSLSTEEQILFMTQTNYSDESFSSSIKIINNTKNYGMKDFTREQVLAYYRHVSMPQVMHVLTYDILAFIAKYQLLDLFLAGNIDAVSGLFKFLEDAQRSTKISLRKQAEQDLKIWKDLKTRSFLKVSDVEFLGLLASVILPEMDQEARNLTIANLKTRFKEQQ